jgi:threonine/homoserine/homoserine lactone efflux protein
MPSDSSTAFTAFTGFGLGVALASAPGPVQAVLLAEAVRGGVLRGLRALAGTALTFATVLLIIALGLSVARLSGAVLGILKLSGGVLLLWLAADALRSRHKVDPADNGVIAVKSSLAPGSCVVGSSEDTVLSRRHRSMP